MQQSISKETHSLLSVESFRVACSSALKEMAISCDLTELEEVILLLKSAVFFSLWSMKIFGHFCHFQVRMF